MHSWPSGRFSREWGQVPPSPTSAVTERIGRRTFYRLVVSTDGYKLPSHELRPVFVWNSLLSGVTWVASGQGKASILPLNPV